MGGRYLMDRTKSSMMGQPFDGMGLTGFDNHTGEIAPIGVDGLSRIRQPATLVGGDCGPAFPPDPCDERAVDVECDHGKAVLAHEMEQRQVKVGIVTPNRVPVRLLQKGLHVERASGPPVQSRLDPPREHFESDDQVRFVGVQRGEHL